MNENRDKSFRVRVSEEELEMVQKLADAEGLNASDFVRLFIRRAHAEKFGDRRFALVSDFERHLPADMKSFRTERLTLDVHAKPKWLKPYAKADVDAVLANPDWFLESFGRRTGRLVSSEPSRLGGLNWIRKS